MEPQLRKGARRSHLLGFGSNNPKENFCAADKLFPTRGDKSGQVNGDIDSEKSMVWVYLKKKEIRSGRFPELRD